MKHFPAYNNPQTVQALETAIKKQVSELRKRRETNYSDYVEDVLFNTSAVLANVGEDWMIVGGAVFKIDMIFDCALKIALMLDKRGEVNYS